MSGLSGYSADASNAVMAGHSRGSITTMLLTGATTPVDEFTAGTPEFAALTVDMGITQVVDTRFAASIVMSPHGATALPDANTPFDAASFTSYSMPSLTVTGTDDTINGFTYVDRFAMFDTAPGAGKHAVVVRDANHTEVGGVVTSATIVNTIRAVTLDFLNAYVKGDAGALADLQDVDAYQAGDPALAQVFDRSAATDTGVLTGEGSADTLTGHVTNDTLYGLGGNDTLAGGSGADVLIGGTGRDVMTGGVGADVYVYASTGETGTTASTRDAITDFKQSGADKIDLSAIDAAPGGGNDAFVWLGTGAFSTNTPGQVRIVQSGSDVLVQLNADNDASAEAVIELQGVSVSGLFASDFIL